MLNSSVLRICKRLAAALPLLVIAGCFGIGDGKQSTIRPATDSGRVIQDVYAMVTWIDLGILIVVTILFLYAFIKYRARKGSQDAIPQQVHGNATLELIWTIVPALILIFIAVPTWSGIFRAATPPAENQLRLKAVGHQWWWEFDYDAEGIKSANEMVIPVNRTIVIKTSSVDVIHAFWAPRLAGKIDSMQNRENLIWFTAPSEPGLFYGQCAEFCGTSHANMRFRVRVVSKSDFESWVARQNQPPVPRDSDAQAGEKLFLAKGCIACHAINGVPAAAGVLGPNLNDLRSRTTLASGIIENNPANLARWIRDPQSIKPGALMGLRDETGKYNPIPMSDQESAQLAAYLLSAPGESIASSAATSAAPAPSGGGMSAQDIVTGKGLCFACHVIPGIPTAVGTVGPSLAGLMNRPKIAGGLLETNPANLKKWLKNPKAVKSDTAMPPPPLTDEEIDTVVKFLTGLK